MGVYERLPRAAPLLVGVVAFIAGGFVVSIIAYRHYKNTMGRVSTAIRQNYEAKSRLEIEQDALILELLARGDPAKVSEIVNGRVESALTYYTTQRPEDRRVPNDLERALRSIQATRAVTGYRPQGRDKVSSLLGETAPAGQ